METPMVLAAAANERSSATFANIASPSKSGSFDIDNPATMTFIHFYFEKSHSATDLYRRQGEGSWRADSKDRSPSSPAAPPASASPRPSVWRRRARGSS